MICILVRKREREKVDEMFTCRVERAMREFIKTPSLYYAIAWSKITVQLFNDFNVLYTNYVQMPAVDW
ncbi:hypothetical protein BLOT_014050 [Blomia tropicalis]|nr:hypothetical protein BLOT_014050 [Blomia tropicalis]